MAITYTDNGGGAPNGSKLEFTFTFPVIQTEDTKVALNAVVQATTKYTVDLSSNPTKITFNSNNIDSTVQESTGAPKTGVLVRVFRQTEVGKSTGDDAPKAVYAAGSSIRAGDLNANTEQALYAIHELQDQPLTDANIADGSITSAKIKDLSIANVDVSNTAAIDGTKISPDFGSQNIATTGTINNLTTTELAILDGATVNTTELNKLDGVTATTSELNILDGVTATTTELNYVDGVTSNIQTQLNNKQPLDAELTELATMPSTTASSLADLTQTEVQILDGATVSTAELNKLDGVTSTTAELNILDGVTATTSELNIIDGVTATTNEINKLDGVTTSTTELNYVDGVTSNIQTQLNNKQASSARLTTLSGIQSGTASKLADNTALTADLADLNQLDGMGKQTTITDDDTKFPTSGAIVDYVAAQLAPIGGFEVISFRTHFPVVQPASGVVISIADGGGLVVNGSGTSTSGRTTAGQVVTINNFASNFNSSTVDPGVAILVSSTGSNNVYNYHKATLKEADLLSLSGDINDFAERYRVVNGEPTSGNDEGDLIYDKIADKIKVFDSSTNSFKLVDAIGEFKFLFLCPTGNSGAPTFNGSINTYDLREGSSSGQLANIQNAAQLLVSIDGVIQKPNTGTSQPSEGFAMVDINTIIFGSNLAAGAKVFIIQIGAEVGIGVPGDNQVSTDKLQNLSVTTNKLANDAVTNDKLSNSIVSTIAANTAKNTNVSTNLSTSTTTTAVTVASSDGTNATIGEATGSAAGVMSSAHHDKLDGIEAGATGDQTAAEIRALVESASNSNVFTDTDHGKLNAIEAGATADQTAAEIRTLVESASDSNVFTDADHTKLNAIESGATADQTNAEIRAAVEAATDSNVFTDADHTKLNSIETSATADQTASEIVALVADQTIAPSTIDMEDNERIKLGTSDDLEIYHDGSNSRISDNGTGNLILDGNQVIIQSNDNTETQAKFISNGAVELYYDASKKLETTANGIDVVGSVTADDIITAGALLHENDTNTLVHFSAADTIELKTGGSSRLLVNNFAVQLGIDLLTNGKRILFGDSSGSSDDRLCFGGSQDLEMYHDGTNSVIKNATGDLYVQSIQDLKLRTNDSELAVDCTVNAGVDLYYDASKKLETQSTGVNVIGTLKVNGNVIASGGLGNIVEDTTPQLGGDLDFNGNNALLQGPGTAVSTNWDNDAWEKIVFDNSYNVNPQGPNKIVLHTQSGWHAGFGVATGELGMYSGADIAFYTNTSDSTASAKETLAKFISDGAVELYYDGSKKFETTSGGITVTGDLVPEANDTRALGTGSLQWAQSNIRELKVYEKSIHYDNVKALFGHGEDLQIYHNGSHSYIDNDTGRLYIRNSSTDLILIQALEGENSIIAYPNGQVKLLYDDSTKFETTSSGATITGTCTATTFSGSGSSLTNVDASTLGGASASVSAGNNTIVKRHSSGYIFANYFNTTPNDVSSGITKVCVETGNDGYIRHGTASGVRSFLNVENGATADQSASEILTAIKTVDGSGSGLDADTLDGVQGSSFVRSDTADTKTGNLTINARLDIGNGSGTDHEIRVFKADNNVADHIQFYNGNTRVGEIGCSDNSWLRLNQSTGNNIYTPRYIRADGGFFVDGTSKGINGSGNFFGGTISGASDYSSLIRSNANDDVTGHTEWQDNYHVRLGSSADMRLWHDGSNSYIQNLTGTMNLLGGTINIKNDAANETMIEANANSDVRLRYNNSNKLYTTSYGIQVGSGGGSVFSGLSNYQAYFGFDTHSSSGFAGVVVGSGPNGNSPFIAASKGGNGSANSFSLYTNGTRRMQIHGSNGNIGAPTAGNNIYNASDERLKENMVELTDGLSKINQIKPYSFTWKSGFDESLEGVTQYGFGAHQTKSVDEILVEPFGEGDIELPNETVKNPLRVNEKFIIPMLVKAVQELSAKVETLETKVAALEAK